VPVSRHLVARPVVDVLMRYPSAVLVDAHGDAIHGVRWEVEGDADDWARIQANGWFGVTPDVIGPVFGGGFLPDLPLVFTFELDPLVLQPMSLLADGPEDLVDALRALDDDAPARAPGAWKLLSVMQQRTPKLQVGLTTTYFEQQLG
jgi:hypothetical protein